MEFANGRSIGELMKEHNIELATLDPATRGGFTQIPNFILRDASLSLGAKVTYSLFLSFFWNNNAIFPGQNRLAEDMGMSTSRANEYVKELEAAGLIEITRRGQGKTNLYKVNYVVKEGWVRKARKS
ncbi:MAG: helix-turn-helix domain-containing protein [Alphaproteobacteria bacterium]|nr:helix-turn-helix domain-containing protein [Alphaproteobacteria bacterium]